MEKVFVCPTLEATQKAAAEIATMLQGTEVVAYFGDLGAGKTTFTRYLCEALGVQDEVTSPTFAMVHEYNGRLPIYHFDMYRVEGYEGLYSTGYFDYLDTGVLLIEWSENIEEDLPREYIRIEIEHGDTEGCRIIKIGEVK